MKTPHRFETPRLARRLQATLLATLVLMAGCGGNKEAELIASARSHLAKHEAESARLQLKTVLQANPQSGEARFLLGKLQTDSGDMAGAEAELRRALEAGWPEAQVLPVLAASLVAQQKGALLVQQYGKTTLPDARADAELKTQLAIALANDNDSDGADGLLTQALRIQPDLTPALLLRARLTAHRGDDADAFKQVEALLARQADSADAWALKADLLLRRRPPDRAAAIQAYQQAIKLRPETVAFHVAVITLLLNQPDIAAASQQLATLQKVAPKHPQTLFLDAVLADQRGDLKRARELSQLLLRGAPNSPQVLLLAGQIEFRLNALAQAESLFAKAVPLVPKAAAPRRQLAAVQLRAGHPDKALATLRPLIEANPPDADALTLAAQAQLLLGDAKTADATFARAAKLKPNDSRVQAALALAQLGKGQDELAFQSLQAAAAADKGTSTDIALITAHARRKDFAAALKAIDKLAAKVPDQPLADHLRGRIALARNDAAGARKAFDAALAKQADFMPSVAGLAALDLADQKPDAAKARFEAMLKRNPQSSSALMALAEIGQRTGAKAQATAALLERAIKADPADPRPHMQLVDQYLGNRLPKPALAAAQAGVAALPDNLDLLDRLGRAQLSAGATQQAVNTFGKLAALAPKAALPQLRLADAHAAANNRSAMTAAVRRAAELAPDTLQVQQALANLALLENKPAQALSIARTVQAKYPDDALGFNMEAATELRQRHFDAAAVVLRKALARQQPGDAAQRLHGALMAAKKTAEADKMAADYRSSNPQDTGFVLHLGDMALSQGKNDQAEAFYREVLQRQPEQVLALNNLAYLLAQQKKPGAVALAEQALKLAPDAAALMDTLAFSLAADQQLPRAIELQTQAVATAPDAPQFRLQLAKLQLQAGDKRSAHAELTRLAKLGKGFARQAEVAELLKGLGG